MRHTRYFLCAALLCIFASGLTDVAAADKKGCTDHPVFPTRMPGYSISACEKRDFDAFNFETGKREKLSIEGRFTKITYEVNDRSKQPSALEVVRNYENAINSVGGTINFLDKNRWLNGKIVTADNREVWAQIEKGNGRIWLTVVEKAGMAQTIEANAEALGNDLLAKGHVTLHGIYFDTGKSQVKPESKAALDEVTKLLSGNPGLKLLVVGHTDSVGQFDANMRLSQARAEEVVHTLVASHGVAADRLKAQGAGSISPVATNRTEEGRAQNRRVELVEQ